VRSIGNAEVVAVSIPRASAAEDYRTAFTAPEGSPLDYKNFRDRVWAPLLERTAVTGTLPHAARAASQPYRVTFPGSGRSPLAGLPVGYCGL